MIQTWKQGVSVFIAAIIIWLILRYAPPRGELM